MPEPKIVSVVYVPVDGPLEEFKTTINDLSEMSEKVGEEWPSSILAAAFTGLGYYVAVASHSQALKMKLPYNKRATDILRLHRVYGPAVLMNERYVGAVDFTIAEAEKLLSLSQTILPRLFSETDFQTGLILSMMTDHEAIADSRDELLAQALATLPATQKEVRMCVVCSKQGHFGYCGKCKDPYYCSKACQLNHWSYHKDGCGEGMFYDT